jgi:hypothetical protein
MMIDTLVIARLAVKSGDVLCVHLDREVTPEMADTIQKYFKARVPEDVEVAILGKGITLSVLSKDSEAESRLEENRR